MDDPSPLVPPLNSADIWISAAWILSLLLINAFFVAVEFSLISVRRSRINQLVAENHQQAKQVQKAQDLLERTLSTTQLGITVSSILLGWIGAVQMSPVVKSLLARLFVTSSEESGRWLDLGATVLTFCVLTYLQIVWGELVPKTLAIAHAEPISLGLAWLSSWVSWILNPCVELLRVSARFFLALLKIPIPDSASLYNTVTSEELQLLIASTSGQIEDEERELLNNIFEFGETVASEVMIPRTSVAAVPVTATVQDVLIEVSESDHSRYPVYGDSLDDIKGLVHVKELVAGLAKGTLTLTTGIQSYIHPASFEHESKLISELLPEMQKEQRTMVIIVDEFGGTAGLITIKDLVEEIVGTLSDRAETSKRKPNIQIIDNSTVIIQAQMNVEEANERLNFNIPLHDDYQTVGGFLIYHLQKIPKGGEKFVYQNQEFQVLRVEGPRLDWIKVTTLSPHAEAEDSQIPSAS
jgi:CBS domain containing-hemolysin-like protein